MIRKGRAILCAFTALASFGCSSTSGPGRAVTPPDILNAPIGSIEIDGQLITMTGTYGIVPEGQPLRVMGVVSDPSATVHALWFLSGNVLEGDDNPESCFVVDQTCVAYDTSVNYEAGREIIVAVDLMGQDNRVHRVRSDWITLVAIR